jgi:phospholipid/cholesterol/gamma-HCH transport system substrate-binding protein
VKRDNINYFAVGLFVLAMLGMLMYALARISGDNQKGDVYYTYFRSVAGIKSGSSVAFQGLELGHVGAIEPTQRKGGTHYKVELQLRQGWKVPSDSKATISASGLLSGMLVEIREGASDKLLPPGGEIAAVEATNLFDSVTALSEELRQLARNDAKPLLTNLNGRLNRVGDSLEQSIPASMAQIQSVLRKLDRTASLLESTLGGENGRHIAALMKNADESSENVLRLTSALQQTRKDLDQLLLESRNLVKHNRPDIDAAVAELRISMQRVNTILRHLEGASLNTNELTRQLRQNPGLIIQSKPADDQSEEKK